MEIKGNAHLLFEQSGTFKREFIKLGIPAYDYDIQNNFGETDYQIDLFAEIESAYRGGQSIFDKMTHNDIIMAFFPCIYFCDNSQILFSWNHRNYRGKTILEKSDLILERSRNREYFFGLAVKMLTVAKERGLRMVMENPWTGATFLKNFVQQPSLIDKNRRLRGDYYAKPTAYWFINCHPTNGFTSFCNPVQKNVRASKKAEKAGICSEERSLMAPEYARNFICDFLIHKTNEGSQLFLFDE